MLSTLLKEQEKELRKEWREEIKRWPEMDALASADWWIKKLNQSQQEILQCVVEMTKGMKRRLEHPNLKFQSGKTCEVCELDLSFNTALTLISTSIKEALSANK